MVVSFVSGRNANHQQGTQDGRIEPFQVASSTEEPRHLRSHIGLHHPYSSWCAGEHVDDKFLEVRFVERRKIIGIYAQGDPLEKKYITKAHIQYMDENYQMVFARQDNNQQVSMSILTHNKIRNDLLGCS